MSKAYLVLGGKRYNLQEQEDKTSKPDPEKGDPRYTDIPSGVTGGGETQTSQDVPQLLTSIYETLKVLLQRFDENLPYITRAADREGGGK